jgi:hypothetical protein
MLSTDLPCPVRMALLDYIDLSSAFAVVWLFRRDFAEARKIPRAKVGLEFRSNSRFAASDGARHKPVPNFPSRTVI